MASSRPRKPRPDNTQPAAVARKRTAKSKLDQFYTKQEEAVRLYGIFQGMFDPAQFLMIEPSAGTGAFFKLLPPGSLGYDRDPKFHGIQEADFLSVKIPEGRRAAVIGNPPFGRNAGTAVIHFNYAASQPVVDVIAMILPRSFRKASVANRLNLDFHLLREEDVPRDAFLFDDKPFSVATIFQIWVRRGVPRQLRSVETTHADFAFTEPARASFVMQRVGARAGRVHNNFAASPNSHYFIRGRVKGIMQRIDFKTVVANATGNPSLAKSEIVFLYRQYLCAPGFVGPDCDPLLWRRIPHVRLKLLRYGHITRHLRVQDWNSADRASRSE